MNSDYDFLIIGAGPGGLQLGYFLERTGFSYRILDGAPEVASFFDRFPRTRQLISFNKIHSVYDDPEIRLRWDWNSLLTDDYEFPFSSFSSRLYPTADELRDYLAAYAKAYELPVSLNTAVTRIARPDGASFAVQLADGASLTARRLVVATGLSRPNIPPIPGIELAEGYEAVSLDPETYRDQRVLILGKGNSASEVAEAALETAALIHLASPNSIKLAWQTRHPGHMRAHSIRLLDMYQLKLLNSVLDCTVEQIRESEKGLEVSVSYTHAAGERETLSYDRVIRCTGFKFDDSVFAEECKPELTIGGRFPAMLNNWESTNVPDMFFAGGLMQAIDFRKASSAFIDGFRYNARTLARLLNCRYGATALETRTVPADPEALAQAVLHRVSRTSGLWAQFGFLCDAITITGDASGRRAEISEELPIPYVRDDLLADHAHYYVIDFEWGRWDGDIFAIERNPSSEMAHKSVFLHPVVRRFRGRELLSEHHLLEDLFGMFSQEYESNVAVSRVGYRDLDEYHARNHYEPLVEFFAANLAADMA